MTAEPAAPNSTDAPRRVGLWRAVVLNLSVLVLATLTLNAFLVWNLGAGARSRTRETLARETATLLAEQIEGRLLRDGFELSAAAAPRLEPLVRDVADGPLAPRALLVVDDTLTPVVEIGPARSEPIAPADLRMAVVEDRLVAGSERPDRSFWGARHVYASVPVHAGAHRVGGVRASYPIGGGGTWVADRHLAVFLLYCAGAMVIVTLFSTAIFRARILAPIRVLMMGTARVAEGMFSVRVPEEEPTEIGELAAAFNRMAEELERTQARSEEQVGELQHINELLERTRDELAMQARMAGVGRLAAGVAHEIGNPLSAVIGFVDLLRDDDVDDATRADLLRRVADELQRVHATVRDLLDYARPAEGELEAVDVGAVVQAACEMLAMQRDFDGVEVRTELPDGLPAVRAESSRLRQVLINLLLNARDAVDGRGTVTIGAHADADRCRIDVRDDGPGVADEDADSIFDPFFTTKQPGEGTGLGLSVSLQIVEGFGGRLRYQRDSGGGALFTVELPRAERA